MRIERKELPLHLVAPPAVEDGRLRGERHRAAKLHAQPYWREQVAAHVAQPAGPEVAPHAPDERVVMARHIRPVRGGRKPALPVEGVRHGRGLERPLALQQLRVVSGIGEEPHFLNRAYAAAPQHLGRVAVALPRRNLRAELRHDAGRRGKRLETAAFLERAAKRLLGVKVQLAAHHLAHYLAMRMVRRGDEDGIQVFLVEHFAPVLVEARLRELAAERFEHRKVDVAERGHLDPLVRRE